jgi:hypothetical protein
VPLPLQASAVYEQHSDDCLLGAVGLGALALVMGDALAKAEDRVAYTLLPGIADWGPPLAAAAERLEERQRQLGFSPVLPAGDLHLLMLLIKMQGARSLSYVQLQQAPQARQQAEAACQQLLALPSTPTNAAYLMLAAAHRSAMCAPPKAESAATYRTALQAAKASKGECSRLPSRRHSMGQPAAVTVQQPGLRAANFNPCCLPALPPACLPACRALAGIDCSQDAGSSDPIGRRRPQLVSARCDHTAVGRRTLCRAVQALAAPQCVAARAGAAGIHQAGRGAGCSPVAGPHTAAVPQGRRQGAQPGPRKDRGAFQTLRRLRQAIGTGAQL